jgi:hypothetical protein
MFDATTKKCVDKQEIAVPTDCQAYKECAKNIPLALEEHIKFCLRTKDFSKAFTQIANLSSAALRCLYTGKSLWKMGESRKAVSVIVQGFNDDLQSDSLASKLAYLKCKWSIKLKLERPNETI